MTLFAAELACYYFIPKRALESERVEQFVYRAAFNPAASLKVTMKCLFHAVLFLSSNPLS